MKKVLSVLAILSVIMLTSCGGGQNGPTAHQIVGHRYCYPYLESNEQFYFREDGTCEYSYWDYNYNFHVIDHFTYTIKGKRVEVLRDESDYWEPEEKGTLFRGFTYHSKDNTLEEDGGLSFIMLLG